MTIQQIAQRLGLQVKAGARHLTNDVTKGYVSDLLSDVMANAGEGDLWVTLQIHQNIVAVAVMKSLGAIVLVNGRQPDEATLEKAEKEGIPLLVSELPAFELVGKLYEMGIRGS